MTAPILPGPALDAIEELRAMLDADSFDLVATAVDDGIVDLQVRAGKGACADCLVPKALMREIAQARLAHAGIHLRQLHYPDKDQPGPPPGTGGTGTPDASSHDRKPKGHEE